MTELRDINGCIILPGDKIKKNGYFDLIIIEIGERNTSCERIEGESFIKSNSTISSGWEVDLEYNIQPIDVLITRCKELLTKLVY